MLATAALTLTLLAGLHAHGYEARDGIQLEEPEKALLVELEQRGLQYFIDHTHPHTGLTRDRAPALGTASYAPASIAASGFALTAWVIAEDQGWMTHEEAVARVKRTLTFARDQVAHEHGWFYHFVDMEDGKRVWNCEASTIDTALFLLGALTAREALEDAEINALVDTLYRRVDWQWALNGGTLLTHGWTPEHGFLRSRWDSYSEHMGLYLLGLGAPQQPLPPESWHAWNRPKSHYAGFDFIACPPLFTHQYSHAWFFFRDRSDDYADYWQNSVAATLAQREWCAAQSHLFPSWSRTLWGVTASDSERGYRAWGAPQGPHDPKLDGTLVPCAPGGSLPFAPRECLEALAAMRQLEVDGLWGRYGFADAFNLETGWVAPDVIGIDVGITLVMANNLRSGAVWAAFMKSPEAQRGMAAAGFRMRGDLPKVDGAARVAGE
ncbi:glucoamylase family protein [Nibricoccus sp. IMCC34717]|uniref:glucoamylase family protein n=1 Tax=Nibricoccus sp. IMCC34717 TaxID=3034021 RepID=UPI00384C40FF